MDINDDLVQRLLFAESDFLVALQKGPQILNSYHTRLSNLPNVLSAATKAGSARNDTLSLAHSVASRILNIASCYLHVKCEEENFSAQLRLDCDVMVHQMDALDLSVQSESPHSDFAPDTHSSALLSTSNLDTRSSTPPFLTPAYRWLLDNLHNPYPTADIKTQLAAASFCQVSSINSWFTNARRRIGWTTLCRERFSNCRADMIDAAHRALVEEDPQHTLSPELRHSFVAVKVAAECLYSSTFTRSTFVEDTPKKDRKSIEAGECHRVEQVNLTKTVRNSDPSPDPSITFSPLSTPDDVRTDESGGEDVVPIIIAGSKRRRSSTEPANQPSTIGRPIKRLRSSTSQMYLPSPPLSIGAVDIPSVDSSPEPSSVGFTQPETNKTSPSRKRCLSDADATGISKRPRSSMTSPQVVSHSLPRSDTENEFSIDDWFNTNFDALFAIPPPVDATEPDLSVSWEVELFKDYSIPGSSKHTPRSCPPASITDTQIPIPPDLSNFDGLLQSIGASALVPPSDNVSPSDIAGAPYIAPLDSSMPDMSRADIDWASLLAEAAAPQPTSPTPPQRLADPQPLSGIDLSMLQFPDVTPIPRGDLTSRQAKLHRLHAMQEVVRQMEQELQAEGTVI